MADHRFVRTKIWSDSWFSDLSVDAKVLYLYLLSNKNTHICGYYELTIKEIEFFTGLTQKRIITELENLTENINYIDGWVVIKNYAKHQNVANNVKVQAAIERELKNIPKRVLSPSLSHKSKSETMDSLSIGYKKDKKVDKPVDKVKIAYGEFKTVRLTDEEKTKLKEKYGIAEMKTLLTELDGYKKSTGKTYKSDYATLLNWARKKGLQVILSKEPKMIPEQTEDGVRLVPNPKYNG